MAIGRRNLYDMVMRNNVQQGPSPGEQMNAPGTFGPGAQMAQDLQGGVWGDYEDVTDLGSFINWWNEELSGSGLVSGETDYYDWMSNQYQQQSDWYGGYSQQGGAGDLGFGNMFTGGGQSYDCATQGPAYNSAGECIACCDSREFDVPGVPGVKKKPLDLPEDQHFKYYPPSEVNPLQPIIAEGNEWCHETWASFGGTQGTGMNWGEWQQSGMCNDDPPHPGKKDHRYDWGYDNI